MKQRRITEAYKYNQASEVSQVNPSASGSAEG